MAVKGTGHRKARRTALRSQLYSQLESVMQIVKLRKCGASLTIAPRKRHLELCSSKEGDPTKMKTQNNIIDINKFKTKIS